MGLGVLRACVEDEDSFRAFSPPGTYRNLEPAFYCPRSRRFVFRVYLQLTSQAMLAKWSLKKFT